WQHYDWHSVTVPQSVLDRILREGQMLAEQAADYRRELAALYSPDPTREERALLDKMRREEDQIAFGSVQAAQAAQQVAASMGGPSDGEPPIPPPLRTPTQRLAALRAAVERRRQRGWVDLRGYRLTTARDLARLLRPFRDPKVEVLHVLLLDNSNRVLSHTMETSGRLDSVHLAREIEVRLDIPEMSDPERGAS